VIRKQWVLTAAHCVEDIANDPQFVTVTIGSARRTADDMTRTYKVNAIKAHSDYFVVNSNINVSTAVFFNWDYDIALLRLEKPVEPCVTTASVPGKDFSATKMQGMQCKSAGWGSRKEYVREIDAINQNYEPSSDLQEIDVPLVTKEICREVHSGEVTDVVFCGGQLQKATMTSCIGDSGSPLVCNVKNQNQSLLVGIMIGGNRLCRTGKDYMMFTEVSKYRSWIDRNAKD